MGLEGMKEELSKCWTLLNIHSSLLGGCFSAIAPQEWLGQVALEVDHGSEYKHPALSAQLTSCTLSSARM